MQKPLHPLHAALLAGTVPLCLGVVLADIAYVKTYEIQWKNFASWLLVAALVFCGLTALFALGALIRAGWRARSNAIYLLLLLAAFFLGLIDAFVHAADAWASMPGGLVLSILVGALVVSATWLGMFRPRHAVAS